jgi:hypothetical protein
MKQNKITKRGRTKKVLIGVGVSLATIILLSFSLFIIYLFYVNHAEALDNECLGQWVLTGKYWNEEIPIQEADKALAASGFYTDKYTNGKAPRKYIKMFDCLRKEKVFYLF